MQQSRVEVREVDVVNEVTKTKVLPMSMLVEGWCDLQEIYRLIMVLPNPVLVEGSDQKRIYDKTYMFTVRCSELKVQNLLLATVRSRCLCFTFFSCVWSGRP